MNTTDSASSLVKILSLFALTFSGWYFNLQTDWTVDDAATAEAPEFAEFDVAIKNAIQQLGGAVFPKLNWSSPKV